jgi:hypothetical protein
MLLYYYRKLQIWHWSILQWGDVQTTYHKNQFTGSKVYWADSLTWRFQEHTLFPFHRNKQAEDLHDLSSQRQQLQTWLKITFWAFMMMTTDQNDAPYLWLIRCFMFCCHILFCAVGMCNKMCVTL